MDVLESQLHIVIKNKAPKWIDFLVRLIQIPSVFGKEQACQKLVQTAMEEIGIFERIVYPPNTQAGVMNEIGGCVIGRIPGMGVRQPFILNANIDTAPVENPASWKYPPFAGIIEDGKLYGRGALDDKAGIAMLLLLAETMMESGVKLPGDIIFESVIEDENSGDGTLACTQAGYQAGAAVIIDGTWPFRIIEGHLGQMWLEVEVRGTPTAACNVKRAIDPVSGAMDFVEAVRNLLAAKNEGKFWQGLEAPYFCCLGSIQAGVWAGAVPESCALALQVGFCPPETPQSMLEEIESAAKKSASGNKVSITVRPGSLFTPPFINSQNLMVRILSSAIERLRPGQMEVKPVTVTGHCDLRHLLKADGSMTDACLYGPGGGANPHCANEYYILEHFVPVAQNIMSSILQYYHLVTIPSPSYAHGVNICAV